MVTGTIFCTLATLTGFTLLFFLVTNQMYLQQYHKDIHIDIQEMPTGYNPKECKTSDSLNSLFPSNTTLSNMLDLLERQALQQIEEILQHNPHPMMDDPQLVDVIRKMIYKPASMGVVKYSHPLTSTKQADVVLKILNGKRGGFFVECGGLDGERSSNTLYLEQRKNWMGLLVEMDPLFFMQLLGKNRKSHAIHACLSPNNYTSKMNFKESAHGGGKLLETAGKEVLCLPLFSIMEAMGQKTIDYFSLDVEGQEYNVLKTIPFDKLDIKILSVEYIHVKEGIETLEEFMSKQGYQVYKKIDYMNRLKTVFTHDLIFVKKSFYKYVPYLGKLPLNWKLTSQ